MIEKYKTIDDILNNCPKNQTILDNYIRAYSIINNPNYKNIVCSISGGSDSDIVLDICYRCDIDNKITYVWFDTGLEYQATKDHFKYLEDKYNIEIKIHKPKKSIPLACKKYGQPFISKQVSEYMQRLQKHGFKWEDKSFDELYEEYPNCKMALMWWCNMKQYKSFNISWNKYLKEFLIENPPTFQISNLCCTHAKKNVIHKLIKDLNYDLSIIGVRKAEGGARAVAYKNCFDENPDGCDNYRPVFWYTNKDKEEYNDFFEITLSDCYLKYGLRRTGCCGCSYAKDFEAELEIIQKYEPKLYKAVNNIFKDAYDYTRKYKEFVKKKNEENEKE